MLISRYHKYSDQQDYHLYHVAQAEMLYVNVYLNEKIKKYVFFAFNDWTQWFALKHVTL